MSLRRISPPEPGGIDAVPREIAIRQRGEHLRDVALADEAVDAQPEIDVVRPACTDLVERAWQIGEADRTDLWLRRGGVQREQRADAGPVHAEPVHGRIRARSIRRGDGPLDSAGEVRPRPARVEDAHPEQRRPEHGRVADDLVHHARLGRVVRGQHVEEHVVRAVLVREEGAGDAGRPVPVGHVRRCEDGIRDVRMGNERQFPVGGRVHRIDRRRR